VSRLTLGAKEAYGAIAIFVLSALSGLAFVAAGQNENLRCNDGCASFRHHGMTAGEPWYRSADSWQWEFQYWLALGGVVIMALAFGCGFLGRRRIALPLVLLSIVAQILWWTRFYLPVP
jgi:uncharacterized membrane protein YphA (DoxX/SURF4 family)